MCQGLSMFCLWMLLVTHKVGRYVHSGNEDTKALSDDLMCPKLDSHEQGRWRLLPGLSDSKAMFFPTAVCRSYYFQSNGYLSSDHWSSLSQCLVEVEQLFSIFPSNTFIRLKAATSAFSFFFFFFLPVAQIAKGEWCSFPQNSFVSLNWHLTCIYADESYAYRKLAECSIPVLIYPKDLTVYRL